ncbi:MAG TPA: hypothetical protein PK006_10740 [Saprospiraceae bacterium]|nr:hypothetical protein [Saprospiraceae bacterium]
MKYILSINLCIFSYLFSFAQPPISWQSSFGTVNQIGNGFLFEDSTGNIFLFGETPSNELPLNRPASGSKDFHLVVFDKDGCPLWQKAYGGIKSEELYSVFQTQDGFLLIGFSYSPVSLEKTAINYGDADIWVVKIDFKGKILWDKSYGGAGSEWMPFYRGKIFASRLSNNRIIIGGMSDSYISGNKTEDSRGDRDYWVLIIDEKGNIIRQKTIGGDFYDDLHGLIYHQNSIYLYGLSWSPISDDKTVGPKSGNSESGVWIVKLDTTLKILDQIQIRRQSTNYIQCYSKDNQTLAFVMDAEYGTHEFKKDIGYGFGDYWILHLDNNLKYKWDKSVGGKMSDFMSGNIHFLNSNLLITGSSDSEISGTKSSPIYGKTDAWLVNLSDNGQILWQYTFGGASEDYGLDFISTRDGGYLGLFSSYSGISGNKTVPKNSTGFEYWLVKLHSTCIKRQLVSDTLCWGEVLTINGKTYDKNITNGKEVIKLNSSCDSVICINLKVLDSITCYASLNVNSQLNNGNIIIDSIRGGLSPYKYKWSNGNTSKDLFNTPFGMYKLTITDGNMCSNEFSFNLQNPTIIDDHHANSGTENDIKITSDQDFIYIDNIVEYKTIQMYSIDGRMVSNINLSENILVLDKKDFMKQVYFMRFITASNQMRVRKIIID